MKSHFKILGGAAVLPLFALAACSQAPEDPDGPALSEAEGAVKSAAQNASVDKADAQEARNSEPLPEEEVSVLGQAYDKLQDVVTPTEGGISPVDVKVELPEGARTMISYPDLRGYPRGVLQMTGNNDETCVFANWVAPNMYGAVGASDIECDSVPDAFVSHKVLLNEAQLLNNVGILKLESDGAECIVNNLALRDKSGPKGHIRLNCDFDGP